MNNREREREAALAQAGGDLRISDDDSDDDADERRASGFSTQVKMENVAARSESADTAQDGWRKGGTSTMPMLCNAESPKANVFTADIS